MCECVSVYVCAVCVSANDCVCVCVRVCVYVCVRERGGGGRGERGEHHLFDEAGRDDD